MDKRKLALVLALFCASATADVTKSTVRIFQPKSIPKEVTSLVSFEKEEKVDLNKSLNWVIDEQVYYFLPVAYKKNQGCRFVFVDASNQKIISDRDFYFDQCSFIKPPTIVDINKDGYLDFKVWLKLPHHVGSKVMVIHDLDFIYREDKKMFCESDIGIPCNSQN